MPLSSYMKIDQLLEEVRGLNAADFQDLLLHLAKEAGETFDASGDNAWFDAAKHLTDATEAVARRSGE